MITHPGAVIIINYLADPYFKEIEFKEGGHVTAVYADDVIDGDDKHTWTRGYWIREWNSCACAYEIKAFDGKEYLIIEWKSGDYRFGGWESDYYVMVRAKKTGRDIPALFFMQSAEL